MKNDNWNYAIDRQPGPLTIEDIRKAIEALEKVKLPDFDFKINHALKGMQTVIVSGNNVYYPPDMKAGEIKVIALPEPDFNIQSNGYDPIA